MHSPISARLPKELPPTGNRGTLCTEHLTPPYTLEIADGSEPVRLSLQLAQADLGKPQTHSSHFIWITITLHTGSVLVI